MIRFMRDRELHHRAFPFDGERAPSVTVCLHFGQEFIPPLENQALRPIDLKNLAIVADVPLGED
jgi:hypothetical protein